MKGVHMGMEEEQRGEGGMEGGRRGGREGERGDPFPVLWQVDVPQSDLQC